MLRSFTTRFAGLVILIAGIWGALIPFVGPYFHFALGADQTWTWTASRLYLSVLPGAVAVLGGLLLLGGGPWLSGRLGALLGLAAGIWFVVGPDISRLWHAGGAQGAVHGPKGTRTLELVAFHSGLGALIITCAAYALPAVVAIRRLTPAEAAAPPARRGLFGRRRAVPAAAGAPATEVAGPRDGEAVAEPAAEPAAPATERTVQREDVPAGRR
jgi:hypothetical protein